MKLSAGHVCRPIFEWHLLAKLPGVFEPLTVSRYADNLPRLAVESALWNSTARLAPFVVFSLVVFPGLRANAGADILFESQSL
jgi:hypothetical protein